MVELCECLRFQPFVGRNLERDQPLHGILSSQKNGCEGPLPQLRQQIKIVDRRSGTIAVYMTNSGKGDGFFCFFLGFDELRQLVGLFRVLLQNFFCPDGSVELVIQSDFFKYQIGRESGFRVLFRGH